MPENLPSPHGDEPGHKVWTDVPENGDAGLRGFYALESDWTAAQENEIDRGTDAQIVIVDPELEERSNTSGPAAVETLGADYGTADADSDGELDGLPLYTYQDNDPAGTWRGIFMADDNGGVHSPKWRTHTPVRMLTANQAGAGGERLVFQYVTYGAAQELSTLYLMRGWASPDPWSTWHGKYAPGREWHASSGSGDWTGVGDWRNWYDREWNKGGDLAARAGCIPRTATTSYVSIPAGHAFGWTQERHAVICSTQEMPSTSNWNAMTVYEDWTGNGAEAVTYKFPIYNAGGNQEFTKHGGGGDPRGSSARLLVHPDGGEPGTTGCIGIQAAPVAKGHGAEEVRCTIRYRCRGMLYPDYWDQVDGEPRNMQQVSFSSNDHGHPGTPLFIVGDRYRTEASLDFLDDFVVIYHNRPLP